MAKKTIRQPGQGMVKVVDLRPVLVQAPEARNDNGLAVPETGPWANKGFGGRRASSALNPVAEWETPGEQLIGYYRGTREQIGEFGSSLHDFAVPDTGEMVSSWGSTILDQRIAAVAPEPGDLCRLVYLGTVATKNGQQAKQFQVDVIPRQQATAALAALRT